MASTPLDAMPRASAAVVPSASPSGRTWVVTSTRREASSTSRRARAGSVIARSVCDRPAAPPSRRPAAAHPAEPRRSSISIRRDARPVAVSRTVTVVAGSRSATRSAHSTTTTPP